jgi:threonyl-tRNA synthetase
VPFVSESHLSEVEKTLLYISEARERAQRARGALESAGAEAHLIAALQAAEEALAADHRKLMQRTFFAVPRSDQERLAV